MKDKTISAESIGKLIDCYISNRDNLNNIKDCINTHGMTESGLTDASESFEQGYNNALEFVFETLGIEY